MAIAFVRDTGITATTSTTFTKAIDCTGVDFLIAWAINDGGADATDPFTTCTYNGVSMTRVAQGSEDGNGTQTPNGIFVDVYVLHAPASGSNNAVLTRSPSGQMKLNLVGYSGVNQADTVENIYSATLNATKVTGNNADGTFSYTTASGSWIVWICDNWVNNPASVVNGVSRTGSLGGTGTIFDSNGALSSGANTFGLHWTNAFTSYIFGVSIQTPVVAASLPYRALVGVGK